MSCALCSWASVLALLLSLLALLASLPSSRFALRSAGFGQRHGGREKQGDDRNGRWRWLAAVAAKGKASTTRKPEPSGPKFRNCEIAYLSAFRSGVGNEITELGHILGFAHFSGLRQVSLPRNFGLLKGIFTPTARILLPASSKSSCSGLPPECRSVQHLLTKSSYADRHWYSSFCRLDASVVHEAFKLYARPMLTDKCKQAMTNHSKKHSTLTVHLRDGDLKRREMWRWQMQPPCSWYEKLVREDASVTNVFVITESLTHPCAKWLQKRRLPRNVVVKFQRKTMQEDWCTMAGATKIALAPSSFSHTAASFGSPSTIHLFGNWPNAGWPLKCSTGPGTTVLQYFAPKNWSKKFKSWTHYAETVHAEDVQGPVACSQKSLNDHR